MNRLRWKRIPVRNPIVVSAWKERVWYVYTREFVRVLRETLYYDHLYFFKYIWRNVWQALENLDKLEQSYHRIQRWRKV